MRRLALMLAFALSIAAAQAQTAGFSDPVALITAIYKTYGSGAEMPGLPGVYSRRLQGLIDADVKATPIGEVGKLDFDVFIAGNDWKLAKLKVMQVTRTETRAQVKANFTNNRRPQEIVFDLVFESDRWLIDEVRSTTPKARWTMSKVLTGAKDAFPDQRK